MGITFFGHYLVEKQIITSAALQKAVALQRKENLLFGATACSLGMITDADIERVHAAQRKQDLNFGDMCVKLGILTQSQMQQVADRQKRDHLHLGDALVRTNAIQADALPALLEAFDADQAPYYTQKAAPIPNEDLWEIYADRTYKMFTRVVNLTFKPDQRSVVDGIDPNDTIVAARMTGDAPCTYLVSVSAGIRDSIVRAMLKQDDISTEPREMVVDAVKEFTNIICGSIAAKVMQIGRNVEFEAPAILEVTARFSPYPGAKGLLYPLQAIDGIVQVAIFWEGQQ